jgi:hypothetical protein
MTALTLAPDSCSSKLSVTRPRLPTCGIARQVKHGDDEDLFLGRAIEDRIRKARAPGGSHRERRDTGAAPAAASRPLPRPPRELDAQPTRPLLVPRLCLKEFVAGFGTKHEARRHRRAWASWRVWLAGGVS